MNLVVGLIVFKPEEEWREVSNHGRLNDLYKLNTFFQYLKNENKLSGSFICNNVGTFRNGSTFFTVDVPWQSYF